MYRQTGYPHAEIQDTMYPHGHAHTYEQIAHTHTCRLYTVSMTREDASCSTDGAANLALDLIVQHSRRDTKKRYEFFLFVHPLFIAKLGQVYTGL